ncbi:hypothetical protein [Saccharopolyspora hattusasensis]
MDDDLLLSVERLHQAQNRDRMAMTSDGSDSGETKDPPPGA